MAPLVDRHLLLAPSGHSDPSPVLPAGAATLPLHDVVGSREVEKTLAARLPAHTLMQRAGTSVARLALAIAPHAASAWVVCGPGNNGGDGLVAARVLHRAGRRVQVSLCGDPARLPADAADAWRQARDAGVPMQDFDGTAPEHDIAIDALLGLGTSRPPSGALEDAIRLLNASRAPILAVDVPSALHPDTGIPTGPAAVRATHTLSLLTLKPGLFTGQGRDWTGRVWLDRLGVEAEQRPVALLTGLEVLEALRRPRVHAVHKGSFGDVIVVGGAPGMTGAAVLAANAALQAGAGRVYVDPLGQAPSGGDAGLMWQPGRGAREEHLQGATVVCGCGGGEAVSARLPLLLAHASRLVLDADALNAIARDDALSGQLAERGRRGLPTLLTPHPLEAARLLKVSATQVQQDRVVAARHLADKLHAVVLLKGSGSVCVEPGGLPWINPTGNALLATAGTGDVLAGWVGGAWAAGGGAGTVARLAAAAAALHGLAADLAWSHGHRAPLPASSLGEAMLQAMQHLPQEKSAR